MMKSSLITQLQQFESAFKLLKWWSLGIISACLISVLLILLFSFYQIQLSKSEIYILNENQILKAVSTTRESQLSVEAYAHIKRLHNLMFTFSPDETLINSQMNEAFYLGDATLKYHVDNLKEKGYFKQVLAANISQHILVDSIQVDIRNGDFPFQFFGKQEIIRSSSKVIRSLVTKGRLREVQRSHHNPHGFLIENWEIIENRDLKQINR